MDDGCFRHMISKSSKTKATTDETVIAIVNSNCCAVIIEGK